MPPESVAAAQLTVIAALEGLGDADGFPGAPGAVSSTTTAAEVGDQLERLSASSSARAR